MQVKIINKSKNPLPEYATPGSAGLDLRADMPKFVSTVVNPGERVMVPTGLHVAVPEGYEARIQSRSGMAWNHGVIVANTPGCVDSDYRGEVKVILLNTSNKPFEVKAGDRIAQMIVSPVARIEWDEVETLDETQRGEGGFGSTGK